MLLAKAIFARIILTVLAAEIMTVNYNCKTFIVQATDGYNFVY